MGQAQINVRTRACSRTSIARTKQAALTHNVRGKELNNLFSFIFKVGYSVLFVYFNIIYFIIIVIIYYSCLFVNTPDSSF